MKMIFFTTYVTVIRRSQEWTETRRGTPARVEGATVRLPISTDVQAGDYLEQLLTNDEVRRMLVIDVISPYMPGANEDDDHLQVTCAPVERMTFRPFVAPILHPSISVPVKLAEDGRTSEAVTEAFRLVEDRVRALTGSEASGHALMQSVFGTRPPKLDVATAMGPAARDEREAFRLLFLGAMLGLRSFSMAAEGVSATLEETFEYLSLASMLIRRLDRAETRLS
jgi:uncharacterized protein (TIGR02391 family)